MLIPLQTELGQLIRESRKFLHLFSKAKAAKIVRELVDHFLDVGGTSEYDVELCKECIEWARDEKRNFLRQALEVWPISVAQFVTINDLLFMSEILK